MKVKKIKGFFWIISLLNDKREGMTLKEINERWLEDTELSEGIEIGYQTLYRWRLEMLDLLGVNIECNSHKRYTMSRVSALKRRQIDFCQNLIGNSIPKPETIVIEVADELVSRVRERPLHISQCEIWTGPHSSKFSYKVGNDNDFYGMIIAAHNKLKVISPSWLAEKNREIHEKVDYLYK